VSLPVVAVRECGTWRVRSRLNSPSRVAVVIAFVTVFELRPLAVLTSPRIVGEGGPRRRRDGAFSTRWRATQYARARSAYQRSLRFLGLPPGRFAAVVGEFLGKSQGCQQSASGPRFAPDHAYVRDVMQSNERTEVSNAQHVPLEDLVMRGALKQEGRPVTPGLRMILLHEDGSYDGPVDLSVGERVVFARADARYEGEVMGEATPTE
jgi:hypothetical protein